MGKRNKEEGKDLGDILSEPIEDAQYTPVEPGIPELSAEQMSSSINHALRSLPARKAHEKALEPYTDGLPFDLDRIAGRIQECGVTILDQMITVGKYLIWAKEEEGHGRFLVWLDTDVNMSHQRAGEFMRVAQRMVQTKVPLARHFLQQAAGDSKKKLLALLDVSDEEIQEAMETQSFLGKPLDQVETMSYRQIQAEMKKEKKRREVSDQEASDLKHQMRELKEKLKDATTTKAPAPPSPEDVETWERCHMRVMSALEVLEQEFYRIEQEEGEAGLKARAADIKNAFRTLNQKVTATAQAGIVDFDETV